MNCKVFREECDQSISLLISIIILNCSLIPFDKKELYQPKLVIILCLCKLMLQAKRKESNIIKEILTIGVNLDSNVHRAILIT